MKIFGTESNEQVLKELGQRLKDTRISMSYTQKEMAERAGISAKTMERIENGENVRIENLINLLRAMDLLQNMDILVPEQIVLPTHLYDFGKKRQRASSVKRTNDNKRTWKWGEDE